MTVLLRHALFLTTARAGPKIKHNNWLLTCRNVVFWWRQRNSLLRDNGFEKVARPERHCSATRRPSGELQLKSVSVCIKHGGSDCKYEQRLLQERVSTFMMVIVRGFRVKTLSQHTETWNERVNHYLCAYYHMITIILMWLKSHYMSS